MPVSSDGGHPDGGFIEGAMTKMLVFKRLAAVAVVIGALAIGALLAGGETAFAAYGLATPWQFGFQDSATPVMDEITSFHDLPALRHHRHLGLRSRPPGHRHGALQRARQSDALAGDAQYDASR